MGHTRTSVEVKPPIRKNIGGTEAKGVRVLVQGATGCHFLEPLCHTQEVTCTKAERSPTLLLLFTHLLDALLNNPDDAVRLRNQEPLTMTVSPDLQQLWSMRNQDSPQ